MLLFAMGMGMAGQVRWMRLNDSRFDARRRAMYRGTSANASLLVRFQQFAMCMSPGELVQLCGCLSMALTSIMCTDLGSYADRINYMGQSVLIEIITWLSVASVIIVFSSWACSFTARDKDGRRFIVRLQNGACGVTLVVQLTLGVWCVAVTPKGSFNGTINSIKHIIILVICFVYQVWSLRLYKRLRDTLTVFEQRRTSNGADRTSPTRLKQQIKIYFMLCTVIVFSNAAYRLSRALTEFGRTVYVDPPCTNWPTRLKFSVGKPYTRSAWVHTMPALYIVMGYALALYTSCAGRRPNSPPMVRPLIASTRNVLNSAPWPNSDPRGPTPNTAAAEAGGAANSPAAVGRKRTADSSSEAGTEESEAEDWDAVTSASNLPPSVASSRSRSRLMSVVDFASAVPEALRLSTDTSTQALLGDPYWSHEDMRASSGSSLESASALSGTRSAPIDIVGSLNASSAGSMPSQVTSAPRSVPSMQVQTGTGYLC